MTLKKIETFTRYQDIIERYDQKGCASNDYIQREAADLINHGLLYEFSGDKNAFIFVKKDGFWRVYYYLNNFAELLNIEGLDLVTEILYRGGGDSYPRSIVDYLQSCGFRMNLIRHLYELRYKNLTLPIPYIIPDNVEIRKTKHHDEAVFCANLFNSLFDRYSGDYISEEERDLLHENGQLYVALMNMRPVGAVHVSKGGNNLFWMDHLAVTPEARGKHIATGLFMRFIEDVAVNDSTRFSLWTQHQNMASISMYEKMGFKYIGKSTLSMIKTK